MHTFVLAHVSDEALLADLAALATVDRQTTAALLAHIAEVDARQLYLPAACSSMHTYCVRVLHFSEDAAFKRIRAARKFPHWFQNHLPPCRFHRRGRNRCLPSASGSR